MCFYVGSGCQQNTDRKPRKTKHERSKYVYNSNEESLHRVPLAIDDIPRKLINLQVRIA